MRAASFSVRRLEGIYEWVEIKGGENKTISENGGENTNKGNVIPV